MEDIVESIYSQTVRSENLGVAKISLNYMGEHSMLDAETLLGIYCEAQQADIREAAYHLLDNAIHTHGRICLVGVDTSSAIMGLADRASRRSDAVRLAGLLSQV
jgi:hypothetical protein